MSNKIDRSYPGALVSARGDSFLTTFNADRSAIYGHTSGLESALELLATSYFGKGTIPGNSALLYVNNPTAGRVYCPVGYKAMIGSPIETSAIISQAYTAGQLNYVFLVLSTAGVLSLRVSTSSTEGANELWIGSVDSGGSIVNEPAGKAYALPVISSGRPWRDIIIPGTAMAIGASAPGLDPFGPSGNVRAYTFAGATTTMEQIYGSCELQHDWAEGTDISAHVHWAPTTTNAGDVKWQFEYSWANVDGTFGAPTTITVTTAAGGTAWKHKISAFPNISGSGKTIGSVLAFRLFRDNADSADTYAYDASLVSIGIHYQVDGFGSRAITTK